MTDKEYQEAQDKIQSWKEKRVDKALSWLSRERDKLDGFKCPETKSLYLILMADLKNRYNLICQSIECQWMDMIRVLDKQVMNKSLE